MKMSEKIESLSKSLVQANKEVKNPQKNAVNPHFKSRYATLDKIIEAYKESYLKHGITVLENPVTQDGNVGVEVTLLHESGQYITHDPFFLPPGKNSAQGYGSSITYTRRYALSAVLNISADEDDDGNGASGTTEGESITEPQKKTIDKILKNKVNDKYSYDDLVGHLQSKVGTKQPIEKWTKNQASKALNILNEQKVG